MSDRSPYSTLYLRGGGNISVNGSHDVTRETLDATPADDEAKFWAFRSSSQPAARVTVRPGDVVAVVGSA